MIRIWYDINIMKTFWDLFPYFISCKASVLLFLQIIKALNLYRKKTGSDNFFWVIKCCCLVLSNTFFSPISM